MKPTILAIDNDPWVLKALSILCGDRGVDIVTASSGAQGIAVFKNSPEKFPIVLLDYDMKSKNGEGMYGDEVAVELKSILDSVRIVMVSGMEDAEEVIKDCLAAGAEKFICKGMDSSYLLSTVESMLLDVQDSDTEETDSERRHKISRILKMVGHSRELSKVAELISKFSSFDEPVLIQGESGVGKEGIARAVHENSLRKTKPFVAINCAAFGKELLESELFGHERGAFTGAVSKKIGLFEQANGGTIFLDEIGDMPLDLQVKMLRALQEKTIQPVGGTPKKIDFRVVAATHCNLKVMAEQNRFRQDLYYRLKYLTVEVPPLRERPEDIEPLIRHFISQMESKTGQKKGISDGAIRKLKSYSWPGNVRALEAVVKKAYVLSDEKITPKTLEGELTDAALSGAQELIEKGEIMTYQQFSMMIANLERKLFDRALELGGTKTGAAALLGMNHNTMNYRRQLLEMDKKGTPLRKAVAD